MAKTTPVSGQLSRGTSAVRPRLGPGLAAGGSGTHGGATRARRSRTASPSGRSGDGSMPDAWAPPSGGLNRKPQTLQRYTVCSWPSSRTSRATPQIHNVDNSTRPPRAPFGAEAKIHPPVVGERMYRLSRREVCRQRAGVSRVSKSACRCARAYHVVFAGVKSRNAQNFLGFPAFLGNQPML